MVVYRRVRGPMAAARSEAHFEQAGGVISNRVTRLHRFCWRMVCASCHHHIVLDGSACGPMSLSPSWMLKSVPLLMTLQGEPAVHRTMTSFPKFHSRHNWGRLSTDACFVYFMAAKFGMPHVRCWQCLWVRTQTHQGISVLCRGSIVWLVPK